MKKISRRLRHFKNGFAVAFATSLVATSASAVYAANKSCLQKDPPIPVSITLSGGVSLGAYQAGFLHYTSLVFRANPELFETKLITGASAGGLNTLLSILSFCGQQDANPTRSALFQAWTGLKAVDLIGDSGDARALVPRTSFMKIAEQVESEWSQGLPQSCDIVVGVSATRLKPKPMVISESITLERQEEKFTLRIQGRGPGRAPLITNYLTPAFNNNQPVLHLQKENDKQNFEAMRDLLFATSAFPLVFAPQKLQYCTIDSKQKRWLTASLPLTCAEDEIEEAEFVDGGILDNKPLGLADRLTRTGLVADSCDRMQWAPSPLPLPSAKPSNESVLFLYSDLNSVAYPLGYSRVDNEADLFGSMASFFGGTFETARAKDTVNAFEANPSLAQQVGVPRNLFPRASDPLWGFFGFFERDLRTYDFYLGMYDARVFFKTRLVKSLRRNNQIMGDSIRFPDEIQTSTAEWNYFRCLIGRLENKSSLRRYCTGGEQRNLELLADLSIERLRAACDQAKAPLATSSCSLLKDHPPSRSPIIEGESDFLYMLRLLTERGFEYKDLGLAPEEAAHAPSMIKAGALDAFFRLGRAQSSKARVMTSVTGPVVFNAVEHLPLSRDVAVLLGPAFKFELSLLRPSATYPPRWRAVGAFQLQNLAGWLGPGEGTVAPALLGGFERDLDRFSSGLLQTRLRLLAGYQFHSELALDNTLNACASRNSPARECRGVVIQPGLSWVLFERLRFDLDLQTLPLQEGSVPWQLLPALGFQFYF